MDLARESSGYRAMISGTRDPPQLYPARPGPARPVLNPPKSRHVDGEKRRPPLPASRFCLVFRDLSSVILREKIGIAIRGHTVVATATTTTTARGSMVLWSVVVPRRQQRYRLVRPAQPASTSRKLSLPPPPPPSPSLLHPCTVLSPGL